MSHRGIFNKTHLLSHPDKPQYVRATLVMLLWRTIKPALHALQVKPKTIQATLLAPNVRQANTWPKQQHLHANLVRNSQCRNPVLPFVSVTGASQVRTMVHVSDVQKDITKTLWAHHLAHYALTTHMESKTRP